MNSSPTAPNFKPTSFRSGNFEVTLHPNTTQLTIIAEEILTLKHFQIIITPEQVKDLTSSLFEDIEFLYLSLIDAFEHKDPAITVTVSDEAKLIYSWERMACGQKRVKKFEMSLIEENMDDVRRLYRQVERLLKKEVEQERKMDYLEKENGRLKTDLKKATLEIEAIKKGRTVEYQEDVVKRVEAIEKEMIPSIEKSIEKRLLDLEREISFLKAEITEDGSSKAVKLKEEALVNEEFEFDPECGHAESFFV